MPSEAALCRAQLAAVAHEYGAAGIPSPHYEEVPGGMGQTGTYTLCIRPTAKDELEEIG